MRTKPELFVRRPLTNTEREWLIRLSLNDQDEKRQQRANVIFGSIQGKSVYELVEITGLSETTVQRLIHRFNDQGLAALEPKKRGPVTPSGKGKGKQFWLYPQDLVIVTKYKPKLMAAYIRGCIRRIDDLLPDEFERICKLGRSD